jgi:hypothetical protein
MTEHEKKLCITVKYHKHRNIIRPGMLSCLQAVFTKRIALEETTSISLTDKISVFNNVHLFTLYVISLIAN